jgi:uncharacterized protein
MRDGIYIVDGHVHTFSSESISEKIIFSFNKLYDISFENPGNGTIPDVLKKMEDSGIDRTVMANFAPAKILDASNRWNLEMASLHSGLAALVSFHPEMDGSMPKLLEEYAGQGARGIKLHPMAQGFSPDHEGMQALYASCSRLAFPIVFHCGRVSNARLNEFADLDSILPVIEKYDGIPFVLTHMADGSVEDVLRLAKEHPHVYFDTSIVITGFPPIQQVNESSWLDDGEVADIFRMIGADRVLFGSDYPWGSPAHDVERILGLNLSWEEKQKILGGNAVKLFRLQDE